MDVAIKLRLQWKLIGSVVERLTMDRKWISKTTSGVFSYLYHQIANKDENVGTNSSRSALSKGMWVTDLPTNNYEPLEASHGARAIAKKVRLIFY